MSSHTKIILSKRIKHERLNYLKGKRNIYFIIEKQSMIFLKQYCSHSNASIHVHG